MIHPTLKATAVAVAGADIDPSLASRLTIGDMVMAEVNGTRVYSGQKCPLVAENAWTVVQNFPPESGQIPNKSHILVLSHPAHTTNLTLHYANLLQLPQGQPAVFRERQTGLSVRQDGGENVVYILLQFVSHYMPQGNVKTVFEFHDKKAARLVMEMFGSDVLEQWSCMLKRFKSGWGQQSVSRFASRAKISPAIVKAFQDGDESLVSSLSHATLMSIHEAIHWLPMQVELASLTVMRDVKEKDDCSSKT